MHAGVKLENILIHKVNKQTGAFLIKLTDFRFSCILQDDKYDPLRFGRKNKKKKDYDLWCAMVCIYIMLSGDLEINRLMKSGHQDLTPKILERIKDLKITPECRHFLQTGLQIRMRYFTTVEEMASLPWLEEAPLPNVRAFSGVNPCAVAYLARAGQSIETKGLWALLHLLFKMRLLSTDLQGILEMKKEHGGTLLYRDNVLMDLVTAFLRQMSPEEFQEMIESMASRNANDHHRSSKTVASSVSESNVE